MERLSSPSTVFSADASKTLRSLPSFGLKLLLLFPLGVWLSLLELKEEMKKFEPESSEQI